MCTAFIQDTQKHSLQEGSYCFARGAAVGVSVQGAGICVCVCVCVHVCKGGHLIAASGLERGMCISLEQISLEAAVEQCVCAGSP